MIYYTIIILIHVYMCDFKKKNYKYLFKDLD